MSSPAYLDGGPALIGRTGTLTGALLRTASLHGQQKIVLLHDNGTHTALTYAQLLQRAQRVLAGLRGTRGRAGEIILLDIDDPEELLVSYWACVLGGFVPLPLPVSGVDEPLRQVWNAHGHPRFVTGTGRTVPHGLTQYSAGTFDYLSHHAPTTDYHPAQPDDLALLLLTSGSTGTPKAVRLTHANILARTRATAHTNHLDQRQRTFNWMPLSHVGGLVMFHTRDVVLGAYQVHASQRWILDAPLRWMEVCHTHRITCTWAPNYAFALVADEAGRLTGTPWDLSQLTYVMNGGEPLHGEVIDRFMTLLAPHGLPPGAMYPGWGMSETSSGVTDCPYSAVARTGPYVPVGAPQPGTRIRVTDGEGNTVGEGTTGNVQVSGATVTAGYHENPDQNRQSFTSDGWFKTGDLGFVQDGILTVTGRADDQITVEGTTYHGHEIEAAVETLDFVAPIYTVATEVTTPDGDRLAIFFHPRGGLFTDGHRQDLEILLKERFAVTGAYLLPVGKDDVPRTGIGKLRRRPLRERFEASPQVTWSVAP
uniref:AMP-binding protein n=1 Tax=Streptomyces sp. NBC_00003 TaxID=2903608 RepID=A0AAU2VFC3_9ACTN